MPQPDAGFILERQRSTDPQQDVLKITACWGAGPRVEDCEAAWPEVKSWQKDFKEELRRELSLPAPSYPIDAGILLRRVHQCETLLQGVVASQPSLIRIEVSDQTLPISIENVPISDLDEARGWLDQFPSYRTLTGLPTGNIKRDGQMTIAILVQDDAEEPFLDAAKKLARELERQGNQVSIFMGSHLAASESHLIYGLKRMLFHHRALLVFTHGEKSVGGNGGGWWLTKQTLLPMNSLSTLLSRPEHPSLTPPELICSIACYSGGYDEDRQDNPTLVYPRFFLEGGVRFFVASGGSVTLHKPRGDEYARFRDLIDFAGKFIMSYTQNPDDAVLHLHETKRTTRPTSFDLFTALFQIYVREDRDDMTLVTQFKAQNRLKPISPNADKSVRDTPGEAERKRKREQIHEKIWKATDEERVHVNPLVPKDYWLHETYDHAASNLYLYAGNLPRLIDVERRIQRLLHPLSFPIQLPVTESYQEQGIWGAIMLNTLAQGEYGEYKILNHSDSRITKPPRWRPPLDMDVHLGWLQEYAGLRTVLQCKLEPQMSFQLAEASLLQACVALIMDDWRAAFADVNVRFHLNRDDGAASYLGRGGPRWREAARMQQTPPPGEALNLLFTRRTLTSIALDRPAQGASNRDSTARSPGESIPWWCVCALKRDLPALGFEQAKVESLSSEALWKVREERLPWSPVHHMLILDTENERAAFYRLQSDMMEAGHSWLVPVQGKIRLSLTQDGDLRELRVAALKVILSVIEEAGWFHRR